MTSPPPGSPRRRKATGRAGGFTQPSGGSVVSGSATPAEPPVNEREQPGSKQSVSSPRQAPKGLRWATGGGSPIGDCNCYHLARVEIHGTLCGRYGPSTPIDPLPRELICGTCARIAKVSR